MNFEVVIQEGFHEKDRMYFDNHEDAYSIFCDRLLSLDDKYTIKLQMTRKK